MSLRHALLGFLSVQPFSGYDLKKAFDTSVRHFWTSDKAAIYRMLAELEGEGLAVSERIAQVSRPDRHVYALTPAGAAELDRWLRSRVDPPLRREPVLLQLFFSDRLSATERDAVLAAEIASAEEEIGALEAVVGALLASSEPHLLGPILTLHAGLVSIRSWRDWLVSIRARTAGECGSLSRRLLEELLDRKPSDDL